MGENTGKIRKRYDQTAKLLDITETFMERGKMSQWRAILWKEAKGKVLEVGVGTGKNIQYYPDNIEVTAIDFSEKMLVRAKQRAGKLSKKVKLLLMDVENLDFPDETFDTIITTCVFCSVPDAVKGLMEIKRVCKKDGQILMLEHVKSKNGFMGLLMEALNPIVVRLVGANINRDTVNNLEKAGLKVDIEENLMFDIVKQLKCRKN